MQDIRKDKEQISSMFDEIAIGYDKADHLLSMGIDHIWRRKLRKIIAADYPNQPVKILDVATGTGDLLIEMSKIEQSHVVGLDFSEQMLQVAKQKAAKCPRDNMEFLYADALNMPFPDESFDVVTVAFGIRNFQDLTAGICEINRVLKPNGRYYILELTLPNPIIRPLYSLYLNYLVPFFGYLITHKKRAYHYLSHSIRGFYQDEKLNHFFKDAGFKHCQYKHWTFGVATLYSGQKN